MDAIPVIDMTPARAGGPAGRAAVAAALAEACERIGFFALIGHGIPEEQVTRTQRTARAFFEQGSLPKQSVLRRPPEFNRGWIPAESESLGATLGAAAPNDLKESFTMGPPDVPETEDYTRPEAFPHFARNRWPEQPAELRPVLTGYFNAAEALATDLMRLFALGLRLPENWFDPAINRQCGSLRALFYPPQPGAPAPGQLRAGAHTDYGCITVLKTEEAQGGLEVAVPGTGRWIAVPTIPGAFVVNLGDLMRHWTNDRWASTLHRVVNPPVAAAGTDKGRLSLAFFHQPNYDALIDCVPTCVDAADPKRYEPVTSGGHRLRKLFKANAFESGATRMTAAVEGDVATWRVARQLHPGRWIGAGTALLLAGLLVRAFAHGQIEWKIVARFLTAPTILAGLGQSLLMAVCAMGLGIALGVAAAVMRLSANPVLQALAMAYAWLFRGTPVILQLLLWFNLALIFPVVGLPGLWSARTVDVVTPFVATLLGLGLNQGAYTSEVVRAGLLSVDTGQYEAARSIGMTRLHALRRIILPQAMRVVIPPLGNEFISMIKLTSLASVIQFAELLHAAQNIYFANSRVVELLLVAGFWYLAAVSLLTPMQALLERRFARGVGVSR